MSYYLINPGVFIEEYKTEFVNSLSVTYVKYRILRPNKTPQTPDI